MEKHQERNAKEYAKELLETQGVTFNYDKTVNTQLSKFFEI